MARRRSPARLIIALSVAAVLAIFLLYTSFAGGLDAVASPEPARRPERQGVPGGQGGRAGHGDGAARRRRLHAPRHRRDARRCRSSTQARCPTSSRPAGKSISRVSFGTANFVAEPDSLVTKCPSKYAPTSPEEQMPLLGRAALVVALGLVAYAALAGAYAAWRGRRRLDRVGPQRASRRLRAPLSRRLVLSRSRPGAATTSPSPTSPTTRAASSRSATRSRLSGAARRARCSCGSSS